jgi:hypothetical protein
MGTGLNFSKISLTSFPNSAWKVLAVSSNLWPGACSLRCMNLIAIFSPMMSLRWLRYWKLLIQTTPALSMVLTNSVNQISSVHRKKYSGSSNTEGEKMATSCRKRRNVLNDLYSRCRTVMFMLIGRESSAAVFTNSRS